MQEMIDRLEKAAEGSRELDAGVGLACGLSPKKKNIYKARRYPRQLVRVDDVWPPYTTSIDAALTLVPEDPANPGKPMLWSIAYDEDGVGGERGFCAGLGKGYHDPAYIYGHSLTPALALCIAALRARQP